jgi:hypothetical protein
MSELERLGSATLAILLIATACGANAGTPPRRAADEAARQPAERDASGAVRCVARWEGRDGARELAVHGLRARDAEARARELVALLEAQSLLAARLGPLALPGEEESPVPPLTSAPAVRVDGCEPVEVPVADAFSAAHTPPDAVAGRARSTEAAVALEAARRRACVTTFAAGFTRVFRALATAAPEQKRRLLRGGLAALRERTDACWAATPRVRIADGPLAREPGPRLCRTVVVGPVGELPPAPPVARGVGVAPTEARAREQARTAAMTDTLRAGVHGLAASWDGVDPARRAMQASRSVATALAALVAAPFFEARWTACRAAPPGFTPPSLPDDCPAVEASPADREALERVCDEVVQRSAAEVEQALAGLTDPSAGARLAAVGLAFQLECARACRATPPEGGWPPGPAPACASEAQARETLREGLAAHDPGRVLRCLAPPLQQELLGELLEPERGGVEAVLDRWGAQLDAAGVAAGERDGVWRLGPAR